MPRRATLPISKHHIGLFDEDWSWLDDHYGRYSGNQLGTSAAVRAIIHSKVLELRARAAELTDQRQVELEQIIEEASEETVE